MTVVRVRAVGPEDWAVWREVRLRALLDAPDAFGSSLSDWADADAETWRHRLRDVALNLIAWNGPTPVAQASGTAIEDDRVELISMWVDPTVRRTGVAALLVEELCAWADREGAAEVHLRVRRSNEAAIRAYRSQGFTMAGDVEGDAGNPPEVAMVRRL